MMRRNLQRATAREQDCRREAGGIWVHPGASKAKQKIRLDEARESKAMWEKDPSSCMYLNGRTVHGDPHPGKKSTAGGSFHCLSISSL